GRGLGGRGVVVYARRPEAIEKLEPVAADLGLTLVATGWSDAGLAGDCDVLLSTVPRGVADPLAPVLRWRPGMVFFDAVYDPWPTPLARAAADAGVRIVSGLDLLLAQAVRQFEMFTRIDAPVGPMRGALFAAAAVRS